MSAAAFIGLLAALLAIQPAPGAPPPAEAGAVPYDADAQCLAAILGSYVVIGGMSMVDPERDRFLDREARAIAYYLGMLTARYRDPVRIEREMRPASRASGRTIRISGCSASSNAMSGRSPRSILSRTASPFTGKER